MNFILYDKTNPTIGVNHNLKHVQAVWTFARKQVRSSSHLIMLHGILLVRNKCHTQHCSQYKSNDQ